VGKGGYLRTLSAHSENEFINHWLEVHPHATATPIPTCNAARAGTPPKRVVYVWLEDGAESLNVALVEEGIFAGGVMLDMVESQHRLLEEMREPKLAGARKQIEKEIAAQSESDRVKRLITDADYADRRKRIEAAEAKARNGEKGIWSDAMKEERQSEGFE
jgi:endonuclease YncB( thermonuclease family)